MKIFECIEKFKGFYSEHLSPCQLDSTINITYFILYWSIIDYSVVFEVYSSDSFIYIHKYLYPFQNIFSYLGYYRMLSRVPYAIQ